MILTRAARKKAGLAPPPSLFKDGRKNSSTTPLSSSPKTTPLPSIQSPSSLPLGGLLSKDSLSSSDDEDRVDNHSKKEFWIQCEKPSCQKWRLLEGKVQLDTNSSWFCHMHPDPSFRSCDVPEEQWKSNTQDYIYSKFTSGELVLAKMKGFTWWPAIITPDPWSNNDYICKEREGCIYHVEFLGRKRTHLWLTDDKVKPYSKAICSPNDISVTDLKAAVNEANSIYSFTDRERLETRCYVDATGKCKKPTRRRGKVTEGSIEDTKDNATFDKQKHHQCKLPSYESSCELKSHAMSGVNDLTSLKEFFSQNNISLKEFIQTNFKMGSDGTVRLSTAFLSRSTKNAVRSKKKKKSLISSKPSSGSIERTKKENGGKKSLCQSPSTSQSKGVSPTIPDYFMKNTLTSCKGSSVSPSDGNTSYKSQKNTTFTTISACGTSQDKDTVACTSVSLKDSLVSINQCNGSRFLDQTVPSSGSDLFDAEVLALKELEEIEDMLVTMNEKSSVGESKYRKQGNSSGRDEDDVYQDKGDKDNMDVQLVDMQLELVLGEIDELDGLIQSYT